VTVQRKRKIGLVTGMALVCALLAAVGCETASPVDVTVPDDGREFVVDQAVFTATVLPVLTSEGCDNLACHGGGLRGSFQLSPYDDKDPDFDFNQVNRQLNPLVPEASSILVKPLDPAAGGAVHTAPATQSGFLTTSDPGYQAILAWIQSGELQ